MPIIDPDQGVPLPAGTDLADNPAAFSNFYTPVKSRLILRYTNAANRAVLHAAPILNETSILDTSTWYDRWTGTKWLPATPIQAFKTSAQTVNNSTVLVNDTHLVVPIPAVVANWSFEACFFYNTTAVADIKFTIAANAAIGACLFGMPGLSTTAVGVNGDTNWDSQVPGVTIPIGGVGATIMGLMNGGFISTGVAGSLQVQWAQNTVEATNTQVTTRSWLRLTAVS